MKKKQIVVVTNKNDPHTDDVIFRLTQWKQEVVRLNTDDIPLHIAVSFLMHNAQWDGSMVLLENGLVIDLNAILSIWWRRPAAFRLPSDLSLQEREFANDEIEHLFQGVWASLDCYWMSNPQNIRLAGWKLAQLKRAVQSGFEVPRTLVTSNPQEVRDFYHRCHGKMIFKVMTDPFLGAPKFVQKYPDQAIPAPLMTATTVMTEEALTLVDDTLLVPCMFQEYIPKKVELRVTIIGDEIFAAEIHSQAHEQTRDDWRHYGVTIPYRKANLPGDITERCLSFVKSYGLNFSTMDLIVTPDERYVFIENNPSGQFLFIEKLVPELRMTEALASCLMNGNNSY